MTTKCTLGYIISYVWVLKTKVQRLQDDTG